MNDKFKATWYYYNNAKGISIGKKLKNLIWQLLKDKYVVETDDQTCEKLFVISMLRKDYEALFQSIYNACEQEKKYVGVKRKSEIHFNRIASIFKNISSYADTKNVRLPSLEEEDGKSIIYKTVKLTLYQRMMLYGHYIAVKEVTDYIEKKLLYRAGEVVVLSDTWPVECMLCKCAKESGLITTSCQHGLYIDNVSDEGADKLNYLNLTNDHYLVWGKATEELLTRYNSGVSVKICGNPVLEQNDETKNKDIWAITMDQPKFHKQNQEMIDAVTTVARNNHISIKLRMHPQDKKNTELYMIDESLCTFNDNTDDADIIFGHTTSMIFSYLARGYKTFRYCSGIPFYEISEQLTFRDAKELQDRLLRGNNIDFMAEGKKQIKCFGTISQEKYADYFNEQIDTITE